MTKKDREAVAIIMRLTRTAPMIELMVSPRARSKGKGPRDKYGRLK